MGGTHLKIGRTAVRRSLHRWHVLSITLFAYFLFWNERIFLLPWHAEPGLRVA